MLNYSDRSINIVAVFITVFIFVIIFLVDIWFIKNNIKFQEMENRYAHINMKKNSNYFNSSYNYKNTYNEIVKKVGKLYEDKSNQSETKTELASKETKNENKNKRKQITDVSGVGSINIYSTNKWRVKIPKLKLDAPIAEGTTQEAMRRTVGHFEETDKWTGNVALAAHNVGYKCNFFQDIKKLKNGDEIIYSTEKGERKYKVVVNKIIEETDWQYIKNTKDNRLTLITCETNKRAYRRCIQAIESI